MRIELENGMHASDARRMYGRLAPAYDGFARLVSSRARRTLIDGMDLTPDDVVLELGIGTGLSLPHLFAAPTTSPRRVIGLDVTPAMLHQARRRAKHLGCENAIEFTPNRATNLPYPDNSQKMILSTYMLDTFSPGCIHRVLAECRRVLVPGGRIALAHLTPTNVWTSRLWHALARQCPWLLGGAHPLRIAPLLRRHGFQIEQRRIVRQFGLASEVIWAVNA